LEQKFTDEKTLEETVNTEKDQIVKKDKTSLYRYSSKMYVRKVF